MLKRQLLTLLVVTLYLSLSFIHIEAHEPQHIKDAREIVKEIHHRNSSYIRLSDKVTWGGQRGVSHPVCFTDSSGFINALFRRSYNFKDLDFFQRFASLRPNAYDYYKAIKRGDYFQVIENVNDIHPGDIIAITYPELAGEHGFVMLVDKHPVWFSMAGPQVPNTQQWTITVIDCAPIGHGSKDSRYIRKGDYRSGLGKGIIRVYIGAKGKIEGYTWTIDESSRFYAQSEHSLIVGRFLK